MQWLRLLNPRRQLRLEREIAALHKQRAGDKRAIDSLVGSIRRQAPPGSETDHLSMIVLLDGRVHALEVAAGVSLRYLQDGRASQAESTLLAILNTLPIDQKEAS